MEWDVWGKLSEVVVHWSSFTLSRVLLLFFSQLCASLCSEQTVLNGNSVQEIKFEAFDKDIDSDDFLGRCVSCNVAFDLHGVIKKNFHQTDAAAVTLRFNLKSRRIKDIWKSVWLGLVLCDVKTLLLLIFNLHSCSQVQY